MTFFLRHLHGQAISGRMYLYETVPKELALLRRGGVLLSNAVSLWRVSYFCSVNTFPSAFSLDGEVAMSRRCSIIPSCVCGLLLPNHCQALVSSLSNFRHFPLNENGSLGRLWKAHPCGIERILCCDVVGRLARNCPFQAVDAKLDIC